MATQSLGAMADEMEELKRELEALKLQLEYERRKTAAADSKPKPESPKPRRQPGGDPRTSTAASASKELRGYVQHATVGSRCGKWWLRDRQVLSRAIADEDGVATLKVRETWAWSGRTVVLDKIVRLDEEKQQRQQDEVDAEEEAAEEAELELKKPAEPDATKGLLPSAQDVAVEDAVSSEPTTVEQPSEAAETSEPATTSAEEALDSSAGKGEEVSASAKANDEVRESSTTEPRADEASDAPCIA